MENLIDKISFPQDWNRVFLKDIGVVFKGKGISKSEIQESGIPCVRYGQIYTEYHYTFSKVISKTSKESADQSQQIKNGDVLFAGSGETAKEIGKAIAYVSKEEAFAGGDIVILRPSSPEDGSFLGYLLNSEYVNQQKFQQAQGHSVVHLYGKNVENLQVVLPSPPERKKIAQILSKWDELITQQTQLIAAKERQKKGLMQKLLTGEVRFPGFDGEWEEVSLSSVCHISGEYGINAAGSPYQESLPKYLRITDILTDGSLNEGEMLSVDHPESSRFVLQDQDVVFARTGASVGKSYLHNQKKYGSLVFAGFLIRFRPNPELLDPVFLKAFAESETYWTWVGVMSIRSGQPGINGKEYSDLPISLPSMEEQKKIASIYSESKKELDFLNQVVLKLRTQKQGLMQQLLTGKIRVN